MSTTPRTDAAWSATFDGEQISAGKTARALRECSQQLETELTTLIAERDQLRAEVKSCGELSCDECDARTAVITTERDQLRAVFPQICAALGNGAFCTPTVSVGFLESIPNEVQLVVAELRARAERAEAELATERARLDSGQILLTVSGERVWHSGVDLRAAIDAGIKEDAK